MNLPSDQIISLTSVQNVGASRIRAILRMYPDVEDISKLTISDLSQVRGITAVTARNIKNADMEKGRKALDLAYKTGARYITYWDTEYPEKLQQIYNAPVGIFVVGSLKTRKGIGVVGARNPTGYGKQTCSKITEGLLISGVGIISGMARGIDSIAHTTAVRNQGYTVGVMGCGIDICYPAENKRLREEVIKHGAIISEFMPGTNPEAKNFPMRNRIISGLSEGIVVVEAGEKSGAVITALLALDQNREVFAVPGKINNPLSIGCHRLIQQGAKLVTKVEDILEELKISVNSTQTELIPDLSDIEKQIFKYLGPDPVHIDDLCELCQKDTPELLSTLLTLELKGCVIQVPGKKFQRG